ncbi:DNA-methyltransferase [Micromonospora maris]|uniref:DNA-methyltransferase n=1 Tax=Micromonospora maris TaxID=1003110 RepID=UPI0009DAF1E0|nr:site-specific DNA-methyltransferase [Micromonospora maris]
MTDRAQDFAAIRKALDFAVSAETDDSLVLTGDSLGLLAHVPTGSVSLILTDPPYHTTKKGNIYGDRAFDEDEHFLEWMEKYAVEWKRVLKTNGSIYVFCSSEMSARLEVMLARHFRPLNHVVWTKPNEPGYDGWKGKMKKENLRRWYPHSERILFLEHGAYGSWEAYRRSPLGEYLLECRKKAGMSGHKLTELTGAYGKVNHGGAVANWEAGRNIPSREQYAKIVEALESTGKVDKMLDYDDIVRPMAVRSGMEFTDVWDFMSVRPFKGKHPAEKPLDLLSHMISASSYPGDIVLDCFAGSGSTGVAALRAGRRAVCMEIEEQWCSRAGKELAAAEKGVDLTTTREHHMKKSPVVFDSLFD